MDGNNIIFIVAPCILITLKFLLPTNAPLYYTYKMLKYTVKISHDSFFSNFTLVFLQLLHNFACWASIIFIVAPCNHEIF